jgi:hypothetical protein
MFVPDWKPVEFEIFVMMKSWFSFRLSDYVWKRMEECQQKSINDGKLNQVVLDPDSNVCLHKLAQTSWTLGHSSHPA